MKETTESKASRVLVVDSDDPSAREVASALIQSGFRVMLAPDKSTAVRLLRECPLDIIVVRDNPPRLDGFMLCRQVHHRFALPLILLSDKPETQAYRSSRETPTDWGYYIRLPIDYNELAARIKILLWHYGKGEKPGLTEKLANQLMATTKGETNAKSKL